METPVIVSLAVTPFAQMNALKPQGQVPQPQNGFRLILDQAMSPAALRHHTISSTQQPASDSAVRPQAFLPVGAGFAPASAPLSGAKTRKKTQKKKSGPAQPASRR